MALSLIINLRGLGFPVGIFGSRSVSVSSPERFQSIIQQVRSAIERGRLIEELDRRQQQSRLVEGLTHRQQMGYLASILDRLHPADVARLLESLPVEERLPVWELQWQDRGGEILLELGDAVLQTIIEECSPEQLRALLQQLDADDLAYLGEFLPSELLSERLAELTSEEQQWLHTTMHYPGGSVGALMSREMLLVNPEQTLSEVMAQMREMGKLPEQSDKLFVVNSRGKLEGVLSIESLLLGGPDTLVENRMVEEVVSFLPDDEAAHAAAAFERYDLISAPVLNQRHQPVGRLTVNEVMDFVQEENTEDVLNTAGLKGQEDLFAPIWHSARNRWLWLSMSLGTALFASRIIGLFEETIAHFVALAALMPIVAAIGGNTGNQTTTLMVRGLALSQINSDNLPHLIRKEMGLSLLNGLVWGTVVGVFALVFYGNAKLMLVISGAMMLTLLFATVIALAIPLTLQSMNRDPALGSSVLVTALTDSSGFFIFLGLASLLL